jgi:hypothetical protein
MDNAEKVALLQQVIKQIAPRPLFDGLTGRYIGMARENANLRDSRDGFADLYHREKAELFVVRQQLEDARKDTANLLKFAGHIILQDDGGPYEIDGGDIQEWATDCGLYGLQEMTEPCGETCACTENDSEFPVECFRYTELCKRAIEAATPVAVSDQRNTQPIPPASPGTSQG